MNSNFFDRVNDEISRQVNIVEIVGHYVKLTKKGRNYVGLCPFHDDKNLGNFYVSEEKQIFNCFSCNMKGGAIKFVQEYERIGYIPAVKKICEIANISIDGLDDYKSNKVVNPKLEEAHKCLTEINNFYEVSLIQNIEGNSAREYLESRGLTEEIIKNFNIGYAQSDGENLIKYLEKKGFSLKIMDTCGIIDLQRNVLKDTNSGRIIFPIKDENGQIIGFSARIFGSAQSESKYINTRETLAFKKANVLYNYHNAILASRKVGYVYLLEGFMDVIAAYRVDIKSAVCLMGTALTKEQVSLLKRLNVEVRVCLDRDEPGQLNTLRTINLLEQHKIPYKIVNNTQNVNGKDADEILKNDGSDALIKYFNNLISRGEWALKYYSSNLDLNNFTDRNKLVKSFLPELANFKDKLEFEEILKNLASLTNFTIESIKQELQDYKKKYVNTKTQGVEQYTATELEKADKYYDSASKITKRKRNPVENCERSLLAYFATYKDAYDNYKEEYGYFDTEVYKNIFQYIQDYVIDNIYKDKEFSPQTLIEYIDENEKDKNKKEIYKNEIKEIQLSLKNKEISKYSDDEIKSLWDRLIENKEQSLLKENREKNIKINKKKGNIDEIAKLNENILERKRRKLEKEAEQYEKEKRN